MLNEVRLIGRLGKDPEIRNLQGGKQVANFSVACSEKWRDKSTGERKEKTEWVQIVCWNENLNGIIEQYLRKGSLVYITGKLQTREWEKDGVKRYTTEVIMQGFDCKMLMLDTKGDRDRGGGSGDDDFERGAPRSSGSSNRKIQDDLDDTIPF